MRIRCYVLVGLLACTTHLQAQTIGVVTSPDATVTSVGGRVVAVAQGKIPLTGPSTVTAATGHSAAISLTRGGEVRACQTTAVHVSESPGADAKLVLSLDRGALEIKRKAEAGDVLITPDLRFETASAGMLDLRIRVVFEGDTCVENRGRRAPVLTVQDSFGEMTYQVKPGQHVMFEHGSLKSVIDRETTPCGCPPEEAPISLADAALSGRPGSDGKKATFPFPAAASAGLTPTPAPGVPEKPGEEHTQIATSAVYDPSAVAAPAADGPAQPAPAPAAKAGPVAAIGRFFRRIFVH